MIILFYAPKILIQVHEMLDPNMKLHKLWYLGMSEQCCVRMWSIRPDSWGVWPGDSEDRDARVKWSWVREMRDSWFWTRFCQQESDNTDFTLFMRIEITLKFHTLSVNGKPSGNHIIFGEKIISCFNFSFQVHESDSDWPVWYDDEQW